MLNKTDLEEYVGYFVFVDYFSDGKKVFFLGKLEDILGDMLHIVSVSDEKVAFIKISEIINFKIKKRNNNE